MLQKTTISLTEEDKRIADELARRLGISSLSDTVRVALRDTAFRYGIPLNGIGLGGEQAEPGKPSESSPQGRQEGTPWGFAAPGGRRVTDPFKLYLGTQTPVDELRRRLANTQPPAESKARQRWAVEKTAELAQSGLKVSPDAVEFVATGGRFTVAAMARRVKARDPKAFSDACRELYDGRPQLILDLLGL